MHEDDTIPTYFSVRFTDGHRMWLTTDSPTDVLLHPTFLKYAAMCILLVAMLGRGGPDVGLLHSQYIAFLWFVLGVVGLIWYAAVFYLIKYLAMKRLITSVFTPLIVLPNLIVIYVTTAQVVTFLGDAPPLELGAVATGFLRDAVILLVFDVMFSNYVVYQHSAFSKTPVNLTPGKAVPATVAFAPPPVASTPPLPPPQPASDDRGGHPPAPSEPRRPAFAEIQLGGKTFNPADITALRSEDHYVRVYTATQKVLVRARLSEAMVKLDLRLGIQINRSTWVAFAAITDLSKSDTAMKAVLQDGSEESVAVMRQHAVRLAYEGYCKTTAG